MITVFLIIFWFFNLQMIAKFGLSFQEFGINVFFANLFLIISLLANKKKNLIFNIFLYCAYFIVASIIGMKFNSVELSNKFFYFLNQETILVNLINFFLSLGLLFPVVFSIFTYQYRKFHLSTLPHVVWFVVDTAITLTAGSYVILIIAASYF